MHYKKRRTTPLRAKAISTDDPELDPLVSFLQADFAEEIKAGKTLVIEDHTAIHAPGGESLLKEASDRIPAEMIGDLCDKNRQSRAVWPELSQHLRAHLLSDEEHRMIFPATGNLDDMWKRFYEKYPGSPGIITISRVGLNRQKNQALFYTGNVRGSRHGQGQQHVLKKEGDGWVEQPDRIGPHWVS